MQKIYDDFTSTVFSTVMTWVCVVIFSLFLLMIVWFVIESIADEKKKIENLINGDFDGVDSTARELLSKINDIRYELYKSKEITKDVRNQIYADTDYLKKDIDVRLDIRRYIEIHYDRKEKDKDIITRNKLIANKIKLYQSTINDMHNNIDLILKSDEIRIMILDKLNLILDDTIKTLKIYEKADKLSKQKKVNLLAGVAVEKINSNFELDHEVSKRIDIDEQLNKIYEELNKN